MPKSHPEARRFCPWLCIFRIWTADQESVCHGSPCIV
jgi:hypothetical protein